MSKPQRPVPLEETPPAAVYNLHEPLSAPWETPQLNKPPGKRVGFFPRFFIAKASCDCCAGFADAEQKNLILGTARNIAETYLDVSILSASECTSLLPVPQVVCINVEVVHPTRGSAHIAVPETASIAEALVHVCVELECSTDIPCSVLHFGGLELELADTFLCHHITTGAVLHMVDGICDVKEVLCVQHYQH